MLRKSITTAVLGISLGLAAGAASANHPDEFQRQLQMSDGTPGVSQEQAVREHKGAKGPAGYAGADAGQDSAMISSLKKELSRSDGYQAPSGDQPARPARGDKGPQGYAGTEEGGPASAFLERELQRSDGARF